MQHQFSPPAATCSFGDCFNSLRKAITPLIWTASLALSASAWAEDPISLVLVREQGQASVHATLSDTSLHRDEISRFPNQLSSGSDHFDATILSLGANVGLGHGLEVWGAVPYATHSRSESTFNGVASTHDNAGLGDLSAGLKYKLFSNPEAQFDVIGRAGYTHHSESLHDFFVEATLAKQFQPTLVGLFTLGVDKAKGFQDSVSTRVSLFWSASPSVKLIPSLGYSKHASAEKTSGFDVIHAGLAAQYVLNPQWVLIPAINWSRTEAITTDFYVNNQGPAHSTSFSVVARRDF